MGCAPDRITAWLSANIVAGNDASFLVKRSCAARISPTASASKTVCSVSLPRWYRSVATCVKSMYREAAAPTFPFVLDPSVNTIVLLVHCLNSAMAFSFDSAMEVRNGVLESGRMGLGWMVSIILGSTVKCRIRLWMAVLWCLTGPRVAMRMTIGLSGW